MFLKLQHTLPFLFLLTGLISFAQKADLPVPRNIQKAFQKGTRSADGRPGRNYWQNTADYTLHVNFDPTTRLVSGTVDISYTNNSPDTLKQVWFKLYPNLYKKGAPRQSKIANEDAGEGLIIDSF